MTVGPGVGCGLFLGGELVTGSGGLAGELGHIPMLADGPECTCGNRGCLETLASDDAVLRKIAADGGGYATIEKPWRRRGTAIPVRRRPSTRWAKRSVEGSPTLCNLVNPGRIVLAGERADAFDLFGDARTRAWRAHSFSTAATDCELIIDVTDDSLWARGAACLVIRDAVGSDQP